MEPWNDRVILPPPNSTALCLPRPDVQCLSHACNHAIKVLLNQSPLSKESAVLSRFIYKFDRKFRNDIGYRILKKVNTALRRYLKLNLLKDIQNFITLVPSNVEDKYLPTRQMLEYIMVRIMSFSKIMLRICVCSKQASIHYMNRIKRGESHWMSLMPYALLCRIWTMGKVLVQHSCSWYASLYPFLKKLQSKGIDFLPHDYTMPSNLEAWLDTENFENHGRYEWSHKQSIQIKLDFVEDNELNFDNILDYVNDINGDDVENLQVDVASSKLQNETSKIPDVLIDVDHGVSISREYFQSFFGKQAEKEKHSADNVTNKITLDAFVSREEKHRNDNSDLSLTKHLTFMQWQSLRTTLSNLSSLLAKNRKIEKKFKKIWREKCLDYLY